MKKIMKILKMAGILFVFAVVLGCDNAADGTGDTPGSQGNQSETKGVFNKPVSFTVTAECDDWNCWGPYTFKLDNAFTLEKNTSYIVKGKAEIGNPSAGKINEFSFQETKSWSGWRVLKSDDVNGLNGKTFDFEYRWNPEDKMLGTHNKIQINLIWDGKYKDATCSCTIHELSVTKNTSSSTSTESGVVAEDTSSSSTTETYTTIKCSTKYAGPSWTAGDDWESLTIEFTETPVNMQMSTEGDAVKSHWDWGDEYYSTYTGDIWGTSVTVNIATELARLQELSADVTKVTNIKLMDMGAGDGVAKIKSVTATKTDGTTEALTVPEPNWGYTLE
ncbi:MAG: hypothetical protein K6A43_11325 [Treponema sp.]|nr:hypothetical protein [Treponema sp.]